MPELPEVEITLRGIQSHILNKKIDEVDIRQPNLRWKVPVRLIQKNLIGESFSLIRRRAKYLIFESLTGSLIIHLGMSGSLRILKKLISPQKHDHIDIIFEKDCILRYTDPRRFGSFHWTQDADNHYLLASLGLEPLGNLFSGEYLFKSSRRRKVIIKNFIMNSKIVVGIGNIYANEALFLSGIKPQRPAGRVKLEEYQNLSFAIRKVLKRSIDLGGTTLRDFVDAENRPGNFKQILNVYGREGKNCKVCSSTLKNIKISNRSTYFCSSCQK